MLMKHRNLALPLTLMGAFVVAGAPGSVAAQANANPVLGTTVAARYPYTAADVHFITGMISHHAQAIVMAKWAPTHGASASVKVLCERIINAQTDEIKLMQYWLSSRNQPVPEAKPAPMKMVMNGVEMEMMMPGMLTEEQMKQLDAAKGVEFDRTFLRLMIQHHQGAMSMVNTLFDTPGAGQDDVIYKFASDVYADQGTEIDRMQKMLFQLLGK
jgi:uncharacterized protein (DUF305 family)